MLGIVHIETGKGRVGRPRKAPQDAVSMAVMTINVR